MNAKQTEEAKRALRMLVFAEDRVPDFTHIPPAPVETKHAATITELEPVIDELGGKEAMQQADEFGQRPEEQRGDRGTVEAMLRKIQLSAPLTRESRTISRSSLHNPRDPVSDLSSA